MKSKSLVSDTSDKRIQRQRLREFEKLSMEKRKSLRKRLTHSSKISVLVKILSSQDDLSSIRSARIITPKEIESRNTIYYQRKKLSQQKKGSKSKKEGMKI